MDRNRGHGFRTILIGPSSTAASSGCCPPQERRPLASRRPASAREGSEPKDLRMHPNYSGGAEPYVLRLHVLDLLVKPLLLLIRHLAPGRHAGRARNAELLVEPCLLLVRRQHSESPLAQDEQIDRSRASRSNKNYRRRTRSHHRGFDSQSQSVRDERSVDMAEFVNSNSEFRTLSRYCRCVVHQSCGELWSN
jgi:hypothetical protein